MTCADFLDRFDASDGLSVDEEMSLHAASCPGCARQADLVRNALAAYRLPDLASSVDLVPRVRDLIPFLPAPRRVVSVRNWLLGGLLLLISIVMLPLMGGYRALSSEYGTGFSLPLFLVMSGAFSLYAGLFVLSHLDDLATRFKLRAIQQ